MGLQLFIHRAVFTADNSTGRCLLANSLGRNCHADTDGVSEDKTASEAFSLRTPVASRHPDVGISFFNVCVCPAANNQHSGCHLECNHSPFHASRHPDDFSISEAVFRRNHRSTGRANRRWNHPWYLAGIWGKRSAGYRGAAVSQHFLRNWNTLYT